MFVFVVVVAGCCGLFFGVVCVVMVVRVRLLLLVCLVSSHATAGVRVSVCRIVPTFFVK